MLDYLLFGWISLASLHQHDYLDFSPSQTLLGIQFLKSSAMIYTCVQDT
jgi:hypothetical protein